MRIINFFIIKIYNKYYSTIDLIIFLNDFIDLLTKLTISFAIII